MTQDEKAIESGYRHNMDVMLNNLLGQNGYVDKFVGSWHRYVDTQEQIAQALTRIADLAEVMTHPLMISGEDGKINILKTEDPK